MAAGSASELEYHLLLAYDLGLLDQDGYRSLSGEVAQIRKMIVSLARRLTASGGRIGHPGGTSNDVTGSRGS